MRGLLLALVLVSCVLRTDLGELRGDDDYELKDQESYGKCVVLTEGNVFTDKERHEL